MYDQVTFLFLFQLILTRKNKIFNSQLLIKIHFQKLFSIIEIVDMCSKKTLTTTIELTILRSFFVIT